MRLHAEIPGKVHVPTGSLVEMAALRADNAEIALRQPLEAGVAITLVEALFRRPATFNAVDPTSEG